MKDPYRYRGGPVPKSLPQPGAFRFYPDPEVFPEEILRGFHLWPELYLIDGRWTFRNVVPSDQGAFGRSAIRTDDTIDELVSVLGPPNSQCDYLAEIEGQSFKVEAANFYYSEDVWVAILEGSVNSIVLPTDNGKYHPWQFVFVDQSTVEGRRR